MGFAADPKLTDGWETWGFVFGLLPIGVAAIATTAAQWLRNTSAPPAKSKASHAATSGSATAFWAQVRPREIRLVFYISRYAIERILQ
jgi:hypothetical protein